MFLETLSLPERFPPPPAAPHDVPSLRASADAGDVSAQLTLGLLLKNSAGGLTTVDQAAGWIQKAAETAIQSVVQSLHHTNSANNGHFDLTNASISQIPTTTTSINKSYLEAIYHLAKLYLDGVGVPYDPSESFRLLQIASQFEHRPSMYLLGKIVADGIVKAHEQNNRLKQQPTATTTTTFKTATLPQFTTEFWNRLSDRGRHHPQHANESTAQNNIADPASTSTVPLHQTTATISSSSMKPTTTTNISAIFTNYPAISSDAKQVLTFLNSLVEQDESRSQASDPELLETLAHVHLILAQDSSSSKSLSALIPFIPIESMLRIPNKMFSSTSSPSTLNSNTTATTTTTSTTINSNRNRSKCHAEKAVMLLKTASSRLKEGNPGAVIAAWKYGTCLLDGTASVDPIHHPTQNNATPVCGENETGNGDVQISRNSGSSTDTDETSVQSPSSAFKTLHRTLKGSFLFVPGSRAASKRSVESNDTVSTTATTATATPELEAVDQSIDQETNQESESSKSRSHPPLTVETNYIKNIASPSDTNLQPPKNNNNNNSLSHHHRESAHHLASLYISSAAHISSTSLDMVSSNQFDPTSLYIWGECLCRGMGVKQDVEAGVSWVVRAGMLGCAPAQVAVGRWALGYFDEDEEDEEKEKMDGGSGEGWMDEGGQQQNQQYEVKGNGGDGSAKRKKVAEAWFEQDETLATQWFLRAAIRGDVEGMMWLGKCYREGVGVDRDDMEAKKWFEAALVRLRDRDLQAAMMFWKRWGKDMKNADVRKDKGRKDKNETIKVRDGMGKSVSRVPSFHRTIIRKFSSMSINVSQKANV
jgi:TPR repeat protein